VANLFLTVKPVCNLQLCYGCLSRTTAGKVSSRGWFAVGFLD
jgi:hypothetical protein